MTDDRTDEAPAPMPDEPTGKNLVKLEADARGVMAIIPRTIEEAQRIASGLIQSGIVPDAFREGGKRGNAINAPLVLMGVLKSMEVGLPPITGISYLLPINNRFSIWGQGATALVHSKGLVSAYRAREIGPGFDPTTELADWPNDYGWVVQFERRGQEGVYEGKFTVANAKRAGLWMNTYKDPWIKYPGRMLFNRARAFPLNDGFSDALMGLAIAEEMIDILPDAQDGGALKPEGPAPYLSDEPVTEETRAISHEQQGDDLGQAINQQRQAEPVRDLGTADDLNEEF